MEQNRRKRTKKENRNFQKFSFLIFDLLTIFTYIFFFFLKKENNKY